MPMRITCLSLCREKEYTLWRGMTSGKRREKKKNTAMCGRYNEVNRSGQGDRIGNSSHKGNRKENACESDS